MQASKCLNVTNFHHQYWLFLTKRWGDGSGAASSHRKKHSVAWAVATVPVFSREATVGGSGFSTHHFLPALHIMNDVLTIVWDILTSVKGSQWTAALKAAWHYSAICECCLYKELFLIRYSKPVVVFLISLSVQVLNQTHIYFLKSYSKRNWKKQVEEGKQTARWLLQFCCCNPLASMSTSEKDGRGAHGWMRWWSNSWRKYVNGVIWDFSLVSVHSVN